MKAYTENTQIMYRFSRTLIYFNTPPPPTPHSDHAYVEALKYTILESFASCDNFLNVLTSKISLIDKNNHVCNVHTLGNT